MGDAKAGSRSSRAGTKRTIRRRAVGTRDRIITHLAGVDEISDPTGMASTRLAEAVGYPGSSVAFAQLLSGMERDGLIVREIRGKRTYRITLPEGAVSATAGGANSGYRAVIDARQVAPGLAGTDLASAALASAGAAGGRLPAGAFGGALPVPAGFDYDELARRLLVQVVRRLAATSLPGAVGETATVDVPGAVAEGGVPGGGVPEGGAADSARTTADTGVGAAPDAAGPDGEPAYPQPGDSESRDSERDALQQAVAGLERELATAWSRHGTLTAENARLREQLNQVQRDLARERTRRAQITSELNQAEVVLLERLLTPTTEDGGKHSDAAAH